MHLLALCLLAAPVPLVTVPLSPTPPAIDGRLDDPGWAAAADLGAFALPDRPGAPSATTRARILRTADGLALAVDCTEPHMDRLAAARAERDSQVWVDDCVEVFTQLAGRPYRHFIVNPLGTQFDEEVQDARFNAEWQAAAQRGPDRWAVEIALPWAALGDQPADGGSWRLNVCRSRRPEPEVSCWSPTGGGFHVPERFGEIRFGAGPWPTQVACRFTSRRSGRFELAWQPAGQTPELKVDGQPGDGAFSVTGEGSRSVLLEAVWQGAVVYRLPLAVAVPPLDGALAAARKRLDAVGDARGPAEPKAALAARLDALSGLVDAAPPLLAAELQRQIQQIETEASHLAVWAALERNGAPADGVVFGTETSLKKLLRERPFEGQPGGPLHLDAARREMDAGQIVVFACGAPLTALRAELSEAQADGGATLPAGAFRLRRVGWVQTVKPTYAVEHIGLWPDPLIALAPFDVLPGTFESLWVDVRVPAEQAPGVYRAQLTLTAMSARPTAVPVEVRVRSFTIPARPSLVTAFGVNPGWRTPQDQDAYVRNALEHRVSPYSVAGPKLVKEPAMDWTAAQRLEVALASDRPGTAALAVKPLDGAARELLAQPVAAGDSKLTFDLTGVQGMVSLWRLDLIGPVKATATIRLVRPGGALTLMDKAERGAAIQPDGWLSSWPEWSESGWERPDQSAVVDWSGFDQAVEKYLPLGLSSHIVSLPQPLAGWAKEYERHFREKGWTDFGYTYLYDEPEPRDYPRVNQLEGTVKRAAPSLRNMMTARAFPPNLRYVDIWCPEAYSFDPATAKAEQDRGKAVWWYVAFSTRHPNPDVWIDYPALDCRVWPWITFKHDLDGMLYWSVTYWPGNPWRSGSQFPGANGDGNLLYPGDDGQPVDSIRWECLRDGMEDYEVLCLLDAGARELAAAGGDAGLVAQASALVGIDDAVVKSVREWNSDPAALLAARAKMSDTLDAVVKALGHEPVIQGRPRWRPGADVTKLPPELPEVPAGTPAAWHEPALVAEDGLAVRYDFDDDVPFAFDSSGSLNHGVVQLAKREADRGGQVLAFGERAGVTLPAGAKLFGAQPDEGTVAVWVKPDFAAADLDAGLWDGYRVIFYAMLTDGNGLPDGWDEIGLFCHGPNLIAKCTGGQDGPFAVIPSPLKKGEWTHLCLTWTKTSRRLYVDGKLLADRPGTFVAPRLDDFPTTLGIHAASRRWSWQGRLDGLRVYRRAVAKEEIAALTR